MLDLQKLSLRVKNARKKKARRLADQNFGIGNHGVDFGLVMCRAKGAPVLRVANAERRKGRAGRRGGGNIDNRKILEGKSM